MNTLRLLPLPNRISLLPSTRQYAPKIRRMKQDKTEERQAAAEIPKNTLKYITSPFQKENGIPYAAKPFKMFLEKGRIYTWCLCGQSRTQPICDATHRFYLWDIKLRPIRFKVDESKEYWICCCKQTKNRPFCDGSHRSPEVQEACKYKFTCIG